MRKLFIRLFKRRYVYHVVYRIRNGNGSVTITRNKKIKTAADISGIVEFIKNEYDFDQVSVESWTRLSA